MCTLFATHVGSTVLVGRNFDWIQRGGTLHFIPPTASYGTPTFGLCLLEQMGADEPFEGMNTQGLFIGLAAVPTHQAVPAPPLHRPRFNELGIIRYILERAATTQHALHLFHQFALDYRLVSWNFHHHHLIVDAQGHVAVYEEGYAVQPRTLSDSQWEAVTNVGQGMGRMICPRYQAVADALGHTEPDVETAMHLLEQVRQGELTVWSTVYQLKERTLGLCADGDYDMIHGWTLAAQLEQGHTTFPFTRLKLTNPRYKEQYRYPVPA